MAINVVGAGAIGCFVGGVLAANGCRVTLLGRPWLAKDIAENGLTVTTLDGQTQHVPADDITLVMDAAALPPADATLICTKSDDTAAAAESLAQNMAQLGQVYSLQNGLDNAEVIETIFRRAHPGTEPFVEPGMVAFNVVSPSPAHFAATTEGGIHLHDHEECDTFAHALERAGLACERQPAMASVQFAKLILNLNNALNALSGLPLKEQLAQRPWRLVLAACMAEALQVGEAHGLKPARIIKAPFGLLPTILRLPTFLFTRIAAQMMKVNPTARSSMADDFDRGRRPEIDHLNGKNAEMGQKVGIQTPVNNKVSKAVMDCFEGRQSRPVDPKSLL